MDSFHQRPDLSNDACSNINTCLSQSVRVITGRLNFRDQRLWNINARHLVVHEARHSNRLDWDDTGQYHSIGVCFVQKTSQRVDIINRLALKKPRTCLNLSVQIFDFSTGIRSTRVHHGSNVHSRGPF